jgi:hypothetical protein
LIKRILEPAVMGDLRFEDILLELPFLFHGCIRKVISEELWENNKNQLVKTSSSKNRIYLEPGITDYVKYLDGSRRYRSLNN